MDKSYLPLIKATGIVSLSAILLAATLELSGSMVAARIAVGVSLGATITALMTCTFRD